MSRHRPLLLALPSLRPLPAGVARRTPFRRDVVAVQVGPSTVGSGQLVPVAPDAAVAAVHLGLLADGAVAVPQQVRDDERDGVEVVGPSVEAGLGVSPPAGAG